MALSIPVQDQKTIVELYELNQSEREKLLDVFRSSNPVTGIREYEDRVIKLVSLSESKARRILRVLVNLYSVMDYVDGSADLLSKELTESLQTFNDEVVRNADPVNIAAFQDFLRQILALPDTLGVSAKVLRVMSQHEHLFISSDSYTDLRPIFGIGESSLQPAAAVMIHTLKIEYRKDLEEKAIFLALDSEDLYELQETIDRAIKKHESIAKMLGNSIQILSSQ